MEEVSTAEIKVVVAQLATIIDSSLDDVLHWTQVVDGTPVVGQPNELLHAGGAIAPLHQRHQQTGRRLWSKNERIILIAPVVFCSLQEYSHCTLSGGYRL